MSRAAAANRVTSVNRAALVNRTALVNMAASVNRNEILRAITFTNSAGLRSNVVGKI